jgi:hypothetical protein
MKKSRLSGSVFACAIAFVLSSPVQSAVIDAYFGMNFVGGAIDTGPLGPFEVNLLDITYTGGGGATYTTEMPVFPGYMRDNIANGPRTGLPDFSGLMASPTYTTLPFVDGQPTGDGETTRTIATTVPINWDTSSGFPNIAISSITVDSDAFGGPWELAFQENAPYVVGLIPPGATNELDSLLFTPFGDIYDGLAGVDGNPIATATVTATPPGLESYVGQAFGDFVFAAAKPVPIPPAIWLFGSGILGLLGLARKRKALP